MERTNPVVISSKPSGRPRDQTDRNGRHVITINIAQEVAKPPYSWDAEDLQWAAGPKKDEEILRTFCGT